MSTNKRKTLGELEEVVLLTVGVLQEEAYGLAITKEIERVTGRSVNMRAIHTTLYRLEEKGFVQSTLGGATKQRGGRRKRLFTMTREGHLAITETKNIRMQLWNLLPAALGGGTNE
ncbi:MAG: helix-turn-helix transcriptional regulator [Bacteroidota bacterium]